MKNLPILTNEFSEEFVHGPILVDWSEFSSTSKTKLSTELMLGFLRKSPEIRNSNVPLREKE